MIIIIKKKKVSREKKGIKREREREREKHVHVLVVLSSERKHCIYVLMNDII